MGKAHVNSILALEGVPVPLDNNTYAYWGFDNNLVSGINPIIPIVKYQGVTTTPNYKTDIMVDGKFGRGITIDEATINTLTDPGDPTTWSRNNDALYGFVSEEITNTEFGTKGLKRTITGGDYRGTLIVMPWNRGIMNVANTYTVSTWARADANTGARINVNLEGTNSSGTRVDQNSYWNITTEWKKYSWTFTPSSNGTANFISGFKFYTVTTDASTRTIEFTMPQVEQKGYDTLYISGQRYQTNLKYPLSNDPKTVSFWFKSNSNKNTTIPRVLLSETDANGETSGNAFWFCAIPKSGDPLMPTSGCPGLRVYNGTNITCQSAVNVMDYNWHHIVIELNVPVNTNYVSRIWVDGKMAQTATYASPIDFYDKNLKIGYMGAENTTEEFSNCSYDEICLRSSHYTEDEILSWYISNTPFYSPYDYTYSV